MERNLTGCMYVQVLKAETPTRISKRIAAKAIADAFSDDESEKVSEATYSHKDSTIEYECANLVLLCLL